MLNGVEESNWKLLRSLVRLQVTYDKRFLESIDALLSVAENQRLVSAPAVNGLVEVVSKGPVSCETSWSFQRHLGPVGPRL